MSHLIIPDQNYSSLKQAAYQLASCTEQVFQEIEQQQTLSQIISKIQACQTLGSIFNTTASEIRSLLNADRVGVFRFEPGSGYDLGEFVAEDVQEGLPSALHEKVFDHCFGDQFAIYYSQGKVQAVSDIFEEGLSDCHIQILQRFAVRANLIVPVLKQDKLWGLLCIHQCKQPRRWQPSEIEFVQKIASHFAVALQLSDQFEQIREQTSLVTKLQEQEKAVQRQQSLVKLSNQIRKSYEFDEICHVATRETRNLLECSRVAIYQFNPDWSGDFRHESYAEDCPPLVGVLKRVEDTHLMETEGGRYITGETLGVNDIYQENYQDCHIELLEQFGARAYMIAPIFQEDKLWGLLAAFQNNGPRTWESDELELLNQVGSQLGIALGHALYIQKIHDQSAKLQEALDNLQKSQDELIQKEKMAALGQLIAGVAHEINNPLGAIQASASNTEKALSDALDELPSLNERLDETLQPLLFALIQRALKSEAFIASAESRSTKRSLVKQLKEWNVEEARGMADLLMDMGVYTDLEPFIPLFAHEQGEWALHFAYNMTCASENNNNIIQAVERSSKIVFALKNYARSDTAETPQMLDLQTGIDTTLKIYHNQIKRNIKVITEYSPNLPMIEGYPDELIQIWTNLIHNSIQAMEEGGELRIHAQEKNNGIDIEIRDSGQGISQEVQAKMFEAFYTTKPIGKGSGLGLYICKKIVDKHNGKIEVQSQAGDTRFNIWLPLAA